MSSPPTTPTAGGARFFSITLKYSFFPLMNTNMTTLKASTQNLFSYFLRRQWRAHSDKERDDYLLADLVISARLTITHGLDRIIQKAFNERVNIIGLIDKEHAPTSFQQYEEERTTHPSHVATSGPISAYKDGNHTLFIIQGRQHAHPLTRDEKDQTLIDIVSLGLVDETRATITTHLEDINTQGGIPLIFHPGTIRHTHYWLHYKPATDKEQHIVKELARNNKVILTTTADSGLWRTDGNNITINIYKELVQQGVIVGLGGASNAKTIISPIGRAGVMIRLKQDKNSNTLTHYLDHPDHITQNYRSFLASLYEGLLQHDNILKNHYLGPREMLFNTLIPQGLIKKRKSYFFSM